MYISYVWIACDVLCQQKGVIAVTDQSSPASLQENLLDPITGLGAPAWRQRLAEEPQCRPFCMCMAAYTLGYALSWCMQRIDPGLCVRVFVWAVGASV